MLLPDPVRLGIGIVRIVEVRLECSHATNATALYMCLTYSARALKSAVQRLEQPVMPQRASEYVMQSLDLGN